MKNITLIIALIIGTTFALSAQRGGGSNNSNNSGFDKDTRGTSTLSTTRGGGRPNNNGHVNNGRGGNRPNGYGNNNGGRPNNNGHNGHNNNGHHGHNNNGHHGNNNNGHHGHNNGHNGHNNGHHGHNNGHNGHNNGHHGHNNGHHGHNVSYNGGRGHGHNYNGYCNYSNHNYGWRPVCVATFNVGCRSIRSCGYDSDRLRSAKRFVRNNYVNAHQIADIMMMFSFESTKLEFAKYAFHRTCDIQNYGAVFNTLSFNSSRRNLDCYIRDFQW